MERTETASLTDARGVTVAVTVTYPPGFVAVEGPPLEVAMPAARALLLGISEQAPF